MHLSPLRLAVALSVATVIVGTPLRAQGAPVSRTKGFFLGAHLNGSAVESTDPGVDDETESGLGAGLQVGFGFSNRVALFADVTAAALEGRGEISLVHGDLGIRYSFAGVSRFVPFLEAAVTGRLRAEDDVPLENGARGDRSLSGAALTLGGGAQWFATRHVAFGGSVKWTAGEFTTLTVNDLSVDGLDVDATSTRINVGMIWHPKAGR